jgi:hypothetical protein
VAYPTDNSVAQEIMDDLKSALQAINGAPNYRTTVRAGQVEVLGANPLQKNIFPTAMLSAPRITWSDARFPLLMGTLFTTATLVAMNKTDPRGTIEDFVADAIQALAVVDHTRGGYARDTHVQDSEIYIPFGEDGEPLPIVSADLTISVNFAQLRTDPSTAQ